MSKLISLCFIALLVQTSLTQPDTSQTTNFCRDNDARCIMCRPQGEGDANKCLSCLFHQTAGFKSCGEKNTIDHCMIQYQGLDSCNQCSFGYAQSQDKKSCQKITIRHCLVATTIGQNKENRAVCVTCQPGYYSDIKTNSCRKGPPNNQKIANCKLYQKSLDGSFNCVMCEKDYSIGMSSKSGLVCTKKCGTGCANCMGNRCSACNYFYGYFEQEPGKCVYMGLPDGIDPFNLHGNKKYDSSISRQSSALLE